MSEAIFGIITLSLIIILLAYAVCGGYFEAKNVVIKRNINNSLIFFMKLD